QGGVGSEQLEVGRGEQGGVDRRRERRGPGHVDLETRLGARRAGERGRGGRGGGLHAAGGGQHCRRPRRRQHRQRRGGGGCGRGARRAGQPGGGHPLPCAGERGERQRGGDDRARPHTRSVRMYVLLARAMSRPSPSTTAASANATLRPPLTTLAVQRSTVPTCAGPRKLTLISALALNTLRSRPRAQVT